MTPLIEQHLEPIRALCRQYGVGCLELIGSAATGTFDAETSDLDFVVEFEPGEERDAFGRYFGLRQALIDLLGRDVDLVMSDAPKNPYFIKSINACREIVYAV